MKKKVFYVLLVVMLGLTGCGNKNSGNTDNNNSLAKAEAIILNNDNVKEELTSNQLIMVYEENSAKYNSKYFTAGIEIYGTVDKVSARTYYDNSTSLSDVIYLQEGWVILLEEGKYDLVKELSRNDIIYVSGEIKSAFETEVVIDDCDIVQNITNKSKDDVTKLIQAKEEELKLYEFLDDIKSDMELLYNASGNNAWGQSSIDSFKEGIIDSWEDFDIDLKLISLDISTIETDVETIKNNCKDMMDLIRIIVNDFNSTNVKNIKNLASETISNINNIQEKIKYN